MWSKIIVRPNFETLIFLSMTTPSGHLFVQSQQWKYQTNVWNLFKINNEGTRTRSMISFWCLYFEQISHIGLVFPLLALNK